MLPVALILLACLFGLLLLGRIGGSRRSALLPRWPALALATAAIFMLARGAVEPALALGCLAGLAWVAMPFLRPTPAVAPTAPDPADIEARRILGVGLGATGADIRSAYRAKIAAAHPDRGGAHDEAARLTAARDRLLRNK